MDKDSSPSVEDRAGKAYWEKSWASSDVAPAIDISGKKLNDHTDVLYYRHIASVLGVGAPNEERVLIEAGCGNSRWLPFFANHFGFLVKGVDYSPAGCEASRNILSVAGVDGEIIEADLFNLPENLEGTADVVFSNGLVEHFTPTTDIVLPLGQMLKPGGLMITFIPNLTSLMGFVQKHLDRSVYDVHVPLSLLDLASAHKKAGLDIVYSSYVGSINLSMLNYPIRSSLWWYRPALRLAAWISKVVWILERLGMPEIKNAFTSPYIICVARKS